MGSRQPDPDDRCAVLVGPAQPDDLDEIARVWYEAWHDGHVGHVSDALLDSAIGPTSASRLGPRRTASGWRGSRAMSSESSRLLDAGNARTRELAETTLRDVRSAMGMNCSNPQ